jgi:hypothetical protein
MIKEERSASQWEGERPCEPKPFRGPRESGLAGTLALPAGYLFFSLSNSAMNALGPPG